MDPDELLEDIEGQFIDIANAKYTREEAVEAFDQLADRCAELTLWMGCGGYLPRKWQR
jgi:hypothetical protein